MINIAIVYGTLKEFDKAFAYLSESSEILREQGYKSLSKFNEETPKRSLTGMSEYDKSLEFQFRVMNLRESISDKGGKAQSLSSIGNLYYSAGKFNLAEKYFLDSLKLSIDIGDTVNQTQNCIHLGRLYVRNKEIQKGFDYLKRAIVLSEKRNAKKDIFEIHKILFEAYKNSGDFLRALEHFEIFYALKNELFNVESDRKLRSMTLRYETDRAEKEKTIAQQEKEIFRLKNVELAKANENLRFLNEEKNDFMGIAAHDLKNPLSGILSFSRRLQKIDESSSNEQSISYAKDIEKAAEKMFEMITKMLDVTAIESGKRNIHPESFELSVLAQRVVLDYRQKSEAKNIEVNTDFPEKTFAVLDKLATREILDNVFSNALKFSPRGKRIFFNFKRTDGWIIFSIKDQGPGLTEKDKTKLFGKFTKLSAQPTGNENSTGLGLSIAKKLTEAMNGKISCRSEEGLGAEFIIELPVNLTS